MKKLNWLDKFAEEQAKKMNKVASTQKTAEQVIVSPEDVPDAQDGANVEFNGEPYTVVNANFEDEMGAGVVLEKAAAYEGLEKDPMGLSMGVTPPTGSASSQGQQYHNTKLDIEQTFDNDQDAAWGQSSAPATEQMIAGENAIDRTTVPGTYTNSPGLNAAPAVDPLAPVENVMVEDAPAMSATEEVPAEEAPITEEVTEVEDTPVVEDAPVTEDVPVEETTEVVPEEEKEENKLASNRILNRIYQKGTK